MKALILAAGFGTRLKPHTEKLAKPVISFLNQPLFTYPLYYLEQASLSQLTFNLHHLPESIQPVAEKVGRERSLSTHFSIETPEILDSAGGIKKAEEFLSGDGYFATANADSLLLAWDANFINKMLEKQNSSEALACLHLCPKEGLGETVSAIWVDDQFLMKDVGFKAAEGLKPYHYTGFMTLSDQVFDLIPEEKPSHILTDILLPYIAEGGKVCTYVDDSVESLETGNENDFLSAIEFCLQQLKDEGPYAAVIKKILEHNGSSCEKISSGIFGDSSAEIKAPVDADFKAFLGKNSVVNDGVKTQGFLVLADEQTLPSGAELNNSVVIDDSEVHENSLFQNKIIL